MLISGCFFHGVCGIRWRKKGPMMAARVAPHTAPHSKAVATYITGASTDGCCLTVGSSRQPSNEEVENTQLKQRPCQRHHVPTCQCREFASGRFLLSSTCSRFTIALGHPQLLEPGLTGKCLQACQFDIVFGPLNQWGSPTKTQPGNPLHPLLHRFNFRLYPLTIQNAAKLAGLQ